MNLYEIYAFNNRYQAIKNDYLIGIVKPNSKRYKLIRKKESKLKKLRNECPHEYIRVVYNKRKTKKAFILEICIACGEIKNKDKNFVTNEEQEEMFKMVSKYFNIRLEGKIPEKDEIISNSLHQELLREVTWLVENI